MPPGVSTSTAIRRSASNASGEQKLFTCRLACAGPAKLDRDVGRGAVAHGQLSGGPGRWHGESSAGSRVQLDRAVPRGVDEIGHCGEDTVPAVQLEALVGARDPASTGERQDDHLVVLGVDLGGSAGRQFEDPAAR